MRLLGLLLVLLAQQPAFDVASVKASDPAARGSRVVFSPQSQIDIRNTPLDVIIRSAFDTSEYQIINAPKWTSGRTFDIQAKAPAGTSVMELKKMTQALLAERFHLKIHTATRELPVYALVAAKNGLHLTPPKEAGPQRMNFNTAGGSSRGYSMNMESFAAHLATWLDRPLVNNVTITDLFDFYLSWAPGPESINNPAYTRFPPPPGSNDPRPDLFTALQQQLGLKLNAEKALLDVIVIDSVEQPAAN